jgi:5-methylcytosine-specific restriction endonuclease McrA
MPSLTTQTGLAVQMADDIIGEKSLVTLSCVVCSSLFSYRKSGGRHRHFCSTDCSIARYKGQQYARLPEQPCATCGTVFAPRKSYVGGNDQRYCSRSCRPLTMPRLYSTRALQRAAVEHRRRARKKGGDAQRFDPLIVYERDNWMCGICGAAVDRSAVFPAHMSASLDHIVPLASGGEHSINNSQCSHWICNSRKGNRAI